MYLRRAPNENSRKFPPPDFAVRTYKDMDYVKKYYENDLRLFCALFTTSIKINEGYTYFEWTPMLC